MSFAARLRDARRADFVGRDEELDGFTAALTADEPPFQVLYVWGPGGVGKTALLRAFEERCRAHDVPVRYLDAREIEPTPTGFRLALREEPLDPSRRHVLLVDTWEEARALDGWLREVFLPEAPDTLLIVLAGRERPAEVWRTDPGWRALVAQWPLRNLAPDEAKALLVARQVPPEQHAPALTFTRGHPLALALVIESVASAPDVPFAVDEAPDVVGALLRRFISEVRGPVYRYALEACALARTTTEGLLDALCDGAPATELFEWLRGLSFVQVGREGLMPHDLVRDVLVADLRWRHPDRYEALHARARRYYTTRLQTATPSEQQRALADYAFLYRDHPIAGPLIASLRQRWREGEAHADGPPRAGEGPLLRTMVEAHEGPEGARLFDYWCERQPGDVEVFRDAHGAPAGLLVRLMLDAVTTEDEAADPAVAAAVSAIRRTSPLRAGDRGLLFRFWMDRDGYQHVSTVQSLIFARMVWHYLTTPGLAFSLLPCAAPHAWGPILAFAGLRRVTAGDFEVDGHAFEAYGHDWRAEPPEAWLAALAGRSPNLPSMPEPAEPALVVLSRAAFEEAVKDALKAYATPHRLRGNPLLRSRLVATRAGGGDEAERIAALRELLVEAVDGLEASPKEAVHGRAVALTYLKPSPSQAIAAERLDVPFSTFRRHLGRGIEDVVEVLWALEVG